MRVVERREDFALELCTRDRVVPNARGEVRQRSEFIGFPHLVTGVKCKGKLEGDSHERCPLIVNITQLRRTRNVGEVRYKALDHKPVCAA